MTSFQTKCILQQSGIRDQFLTMGYLSTPGCKWEKFCRLQGMGHIKITLYSYTNLIFHGIS